MRGFETKEQGRALNPSLFHQHLLRQYD